MPRHVQQRLAQLRLPAEPLRALDQPQVQLVFKGPQVGNKPGLKSLRIVDQVAGMHFEEFRQQQARRVSQVRARAALDLRKIRLADGLAQLLLDGSNHFLLRHLAFEAPQGAFHFPQVADFLSQFHYCNP